MERGRSYVYYLLGGVERDVCVWRGGVTPPPNFLAFVCIFTKYVRKISWPNVVGKFGVFYEKRNAEFYQYPVPQKLNFHWWWRLLKKLCKICTDD